MPRMVHRLPINSAFNESLILQALKLLHDSLARSKGVLISTANVTSESLLLFFLKIYGPTFKPKYVVCMWKRT